DSQRTDARRLLDPAFRHAFEHLLHEVGPDRNRREAALLAPSKRTSLIEADPGRPDAVRTQPREPRVTRAVRRTGLAGDVVAPERAVRRGAGTARHDVAENVRDEVSVLRRDRPPRAPAAQTRIKVR